MARDEILEAVERRRRKSVLKLFIENPTKVIDEKPYVVYIISAGISLIFVAVMLYFKAEISQVIIFTVVLSILPPGLYDFRKKARIKRVEAEFPALLRDISLSVKAGMTIKGALTVCAQGQYGVLTPAIKHLDSLMEWGISFDESLLYLARKYPTPLIRRAVATIIEASKTGGEIGPILASVAADAEETKALVRKRSSDTQPYLAVCYMSYLVFLAVILILSHYFIGMMAELVQESGREQFAGGIQFRVSKEDIELYRRLFFHAAVIQGGFSGIVTGKMAEGTILAGLKHSLIFIIVALIAYRFIAPG